MRFVVSLAVLTAFAVPAVAQDAPAESKPVEKKICRTIPVTGSMMGRRECHTKGEWEAIAEQSRSARDRWDRESRGTNGRMGVQRGD